MNKQSLQELRDRVAAGEYDATNERVAQFNRFAHDFEQAFANSQNNSTAWQAYNCSLDAAVAFLEAVLPDYRWAVNSGGFDADRTGEPNCYLYPPNGRPIHSYADTPARALFLATLKVLIERAE